MGKKDQRIVTMRALAQIRGPLLVVVEFFTKKRILFIIVKYVTKNLISHGKKRNFSIKIVTICFLSTIVFSNDNKCVFVSYKMCTKKATF